VAHEARRRAKVRVARLTRTVLSEGERTRLLWLAVVVRKECEMKRRVVLGGLLAVAALFAAGCWPFGDDENGVTISDRDDGTTVQMHKGDTLTVRLGSNITTGFRWYVGESAGPELQFVGESPYEEPSSKTPVLGAPGTQVFNFKAVGTGVVQVAMEYRQGVDPDVTAARTFHFTAEIR
jgi:inhibitor of cysteine peptidase